MLSAVHHAFMHFVPLEHVQLTTSAKASTTQLTFSFARGGPPSLGDGRLIYTCIHCHHMQSFSLLDFLWYSCYSKLNGGKERHQICLLKISAQLEDAFRTLHYQFAKICVHPLHRLQASHVSPLASNWSEDCGVPLLFEARQNARCRGCSTL